MGKRRGAVPAIYDAREFTEDGAIGCGPTLLLQIFWRTLCGAEYQGQEAERSSGHARYFTKGKYPASTLVQITSLVRARQLDRDRCGCRSEQAILTNRKKAARSHSDSDRDALGSHAPYRRVCLFAAAGRLADREPTSVVGRENGLGSRHKGSSSPRCAPQACMAERCGGEKL